MELKNTTQEITPDQQVKDSVKIPSLNHKGIVTPILIAIVTLLVITTGGYFIYKNQSKTATSLQQMSQPSPSPISDETVNWKIYTDKDNGIQFKYPDEWKLSSYPYDSVLLLSPDYKREEDRIDDVIIQGAKLNFDILTDKNASFFSGKTHPCIDCPPKKVTNTKQFTIQGLPAIQQDSDNLVAVQVAKDNKYYSLSMAYSTNSSKDIFNQILSTFKFLDQTQSTSNEELTIMDGSVYSILPSGNRQLLFDKKNLGGTSLYPYQFESLQESPDKKKVIIFANKGLSLLTLYYSSIGQPSLKELGPGQDVSWSSNSRYIAFLTKPADAGPLSRMYLYDTESNKQIDIAAVAKTKITSLQYCYLGFEEIKWLDDSSGIRVRYTAYECGDGAIVNDSVVGRGETVIQLNSI